MEELNSKKPLPKWLIMLLIVLSIAVVVALVLGLAKPADNQNPVEVIQPVSEEDSAEPATVPLATNYIVLSYPAELEEDVKIAYEEISDGQKITFTTDFTGEELELFHFTISKSGTEGYAIGVLEDEQHGSLVVCMNVHEYSNGNWKPEDFNKINAMQERVNDIIIQFYDDPRFTPNK